MNLPMNLPSVLIVWMSVMSFTCGTDRLKIKSEELGSDYWNKIAKKTLEDALKPAVVKKAKNIIFFLGDGMGMSTITASRIYEGQQRKNLAGEENFLSFETFPNVALSKTYNVDKQVPDSAGTATAYLGGVKGNYHTIGVTGKVKAGDCKPSLDPKNRVESIMKWAQDAGKATGFVTTMRVTHATPAGLYAHTAERDWENDRKIPTDQRECLDIAVQLLENNASQNAKVIFGGGRKNFLPTVKDGRTDGQDLVDKWQSMKKERNVNYKYVKNLIEFQQIDVANTDYVFGMFNDDHMKYEEEWKANPSVVRDEPSLSEMTLTSIKMLEKDPNGYFLFVEGGKIDWAHHSGIAKLSLIETIAFSDAIKVAKDMVNLDETLIIVTADHSHTMTINGYPERGNDILGVSLPEKDDPKQDLNYTTLMYTNGPGYKDESQWEELLKNTDADDYHQLAAFPKAWESHGGEDVPVYSIGPMSHILRGVFEQNYIPHALSYAACYKTDMCVETSAATSWTPFCVIPLFVASLSLSLFYQR